MLLLMLLMCGLQLKLYVVADTVAQWYWQPAGEFCSPSLDQSVPAVACACVVAACAFSEDGSSADDLHL
jgi:hypothetical protein